MGKRKAKKIPKEPDRQFIFYESDRIGTAGAEDDTEYLSKCFVDTGHLDIILDKNDNRQLLLGRTGVGKSALLKQLQTVSESQVIEINPNDLALKYLTNSTILQFFNTSQD